MSNEVQVTRPEPPHIPLGEKPDLTNFVLIIDDEEKQVTAIEYFEATGVPRAAGT